MAWLRLDDAFCEHPRIENLSSRAFRLHVAALCLCSRKLTDGYVSAKDAKVAAITANVGTKVISELEQAELWVKNGHGWAIRDYLDYNDTAERIKQKRKSHAERQRRHRTGDA